VKGNLRVKLVPLLSFCLETPPSFVGHVEHAVVFYFLDIVGPCVKTVRKEGERFLHFYYTGCPCVCSRCGTSNRA